MNCEGCLNKNDCSKEMLQRVADKLPVDEQQPKPDFFFHVGEILTLKGQLFQVKSVKPKEIRLKLWKRTIRTTETPRREE